MNNVERATTLQIQIQKRLELLKLWASSGVPSGLVLPRSLSKIRRWKNPSLGILPIGSTSSFTKTHRKYGASVSQIESFLKRLRVTPSKKPRRSINVRSRDLKLQNEEYKAALTAAANRYAMQTTKLENSEAQARMLQQVVEELEREMAALKQTSRHKQSDPNKEKGNVTKLVPRNSDHRGTGRDR
jgi:hypothetical protein